MPKSISYLNQIMNEKNSYSDNNLILHLKISSNDLLNIQNNNSDTYSL